MAGRTLRSWVSSNKATHWQERKPDAQPADLVAAALTLTGERDQTWQGFGGCFNELGWIALRGLDKEVRSAVMEALFDPADGCRFNFCRIPIGASDYAANWYSLDEHARDFQMKHFSLERDKRVLVPYVKAALALRPDIKFFASPWSPPTWMKRPPVYNHGTFIMEEDYLDAYALYFLKFVEAYAREGIEIAQIHPQNEPVVDQKFPSCVWTGDDMCTFIRDHLGPLLAAKRPGCEIWLGTLNTADYDSWAGTILSAARGREYVKGIGYQWNGKGALQRTRDAYPDVPMIQTENECGDGKNSWDYACEVFDLMQHYIRNGVVAYVYWNMVLKPGGASTWGWRQNSMVTVDPDAKLVTYNHEFYVMKHFSRFIEPGAVRLGTTGPWAPHSVAFENPPGGGGEGEVVVVVRNPFEDPRTLTVNDADGAVSVELGPSSISSLVFAASEKVRRTVAVRLPGKARKLVREDRKGPRKHKKRRATKRR